MYDRVYFSNEEINLNFTSAVEYCSKYGGRLAYLPSKDLLDEISANIFLSYSNTTDMELGENTEYWMDINRPIENTTFPHDNGNHLTVEYVVLSPPRLFSGLPVKKRRVICEADNPCLTSKCKTCEIFNNKWIYFGYVCECFPDFFGSQCDLYDFYVEFASLSGSKRICLSVSGGYNCVCPESLKPCDHGFCKTNRCVCFDGYYGPDCSQDTNECHLTPSPCKNGGTCANTQGSYTCSCADGYNGYNCATQAEISRHCGHGTFVQNTENAVGISYCNCSSGFTGLVCEEDIDECIDNQKICGGFICENTYGSYLCHCPRGYTGERCDVNINECQDATTCHGNGYCIDVVGSYACICHGGIETYDWFENCKNLDSVLMVTSSYNSNGNTKTLNSKYIASLVFFCLLCIISVIINVCFFAGKFKRGTHLNGNYVFFNY